MLLFKKSLSQKLHCKDKNKNYEIQII